MHTASWTRIRIQAALALTTAAEEPRVALPPWVSVIEVSVLEVACTDVRRRVHESSFGHRNGPQVRAGTLVHGTFARCLTTANWCRAPRAPAPPTTQHLATAESWVGGIVRALEGKGGWSGSYVGYRIAVWQSAGSGLRAPVTVNMSPAARLARWKRTSPSLPPCELLLTPPRSG